MERSIGLKETKELAVMIDTFKPLMVTQDAMGIDDGKYYTSTLKPKANDVIHRQVATKLIQSENVLPLLPAVLDRLGRSLAMRTRFLIARAFELPCPTTTMLRTPSRGAPPYSE